MSVNSVVDLFKSSNPRFCCGVDALGLSGGLVVLSWSSFGITCIFKSPNFVLCNIVEPNGSSYYVAGSSTIQGWDDFVNWRISSQLLDIPYSGPKFTWTNKREEPHLILERLDRGYMTNDWFMSFPDTKISNQPFIASDHAAIVLDTEGIPTRKNRPYQIENWCLEFTEICDLIDRTWRIPCQGSPMFTLSRKLVLLRLKIRGWYLRNKKLWGVNWRELNDNLSTIGLMVKTIAQGGTYIEKVDEAYSTAAIKVKSWKQRMKERWVKEGDLPTKLLYSRVKARQKKNEVLTLKNHAGQWTEGQDQVQDLVVQSLKQVFISDQDLPPDDELDMVLRELDLPQLSQGNVSMLERPF
ncbi:uncharacterized protein [Spinacia oleracea]|uniref:Endonuclease/exonuclease/phosphatase domain-containing protein n=1 Tax=Spinacia oleracea TaxID=3562 RepID=A0ABM3R7R4_SPIOL|nr:uncharacterized protein LOC130467235 [Spinacia oleracea]